MASSSSSSSASVAPVLSCAIEETLRDRSFATGSSVAADALQGARKLLLWCQDAEKEAVVNDFTTKLVGHLREAFTVPSGMRPLNRDRLWKSFFSIKSTSKLFRGASGMASSGKEMSVSGMDTGRIIGVYLFFS